MEKVKQTTKKKSINWWIMALLIIVFFPLAILYGICAETIEVVEERN